MSDRTEPTTDYDLFVIGGGINGCGIARDASGRGLKVALAEMNDLASATSSASTKLFHGGLRYLEYFEVRLVRESLIERETLLSGSEIELARPDEVDVLAAEDSLEGLRIEQLEAAAKVADYWNKNPDTSPKVIDPDLLAGDPLPTEDDILSPEEQELIEDLRDRLTGYESEIAAAIEEGEARALSGEAEEDAAELPEGDEVCEEEQALLSE